MYRLEVRNLSITFTRYAAGFNRNALQVITDLNVSVKPGEVVAVVGSSGSGKSLLAHAVLGILPGNAEWKGNLLYEGETLTASRQEKLRGREIVLIPQSVTFLDPLARVERQLVTGYNPTNKSLVQKLLQRVGLGRETARLFPFELSGGMARRVLIAAALTEQTKLLLADEPTPGLHPEMASEALLLFRELADAGAGVLLITHDLAGALKTADRVAVFYAGTTVEIASVKAFSGDGRNLCHPYSRALWQALPSNKFLSVAGSQPYPENLPEGCLYHPRCNLCTTACKKQRPGITQTDTGMVRCIHAA